MRNKHVRFDALGGDTRLLSPLKRNFNLKNREILRRKLKDLLEKDQLLISDKKNIKVVERGIRPVFKKNNSTVTQRDLYSLKGNGIKKNKKVIIPTNAIVKRKRIKITSDVNNMVSKMHRSAKNPTPNIYSKKSKPKKSTHQKLNGPEKIIWKAKSLSHKKVENLKPVNKPKMKIPVRGKVASSQLSQLSLLEKEKLLNAKRRSKQSIEKLEKLGQSNRASLLSKTSEIDNSKDMSSHIMTSPSKNGLQSQATKIWESNNYDSESSSSDATIVDDDFLSNEFDCSSTDSVCAYETESDLEDFDNFSDGDTDSTYKLPDHVLEDIYVAKGAAIKHDLSESNEVVFDSDESSAQVIEIMNKNQSKNNRLLTRTEYCNGKKSPNNQITEKGYESPNSCPELVPIHHSFDFQDESDSDTYSDCLPNDYSGVNHKNTNQDLKMVPEIFKFDKSMITDIEVDLFHTSNTQFNCEVEGSPLKRISNTNATTTYYNVVTVEKKKKVLFDDDYTNITEKFKGVFANRNYSDPSNRYGEKTKTPQIENSDRDQALSKKPHDIHVISNKIHGISVREKNNQSLKNLVRPVVYQENPVYTNNFIKKIQMKTLFFNAINSNQVIALLKEPLYLYGTVKLKLLAGGLDIFGYNPKPKEMLEIFSPRGYGSLKIEPSIKLEPYPIDLNDLNELVSSFLKIDIETVKSNYDSKTDAILILERNDNSKKVNMLKKYMVENLFPNMNSLQSDRPFYTSEFLLRCILTPTVNQPLIINPIWRTIPVHNISRIIIIGGKSVGKTTLTRFLANAYLNKSPKVLLIDLDIGQPEMFVPQTVSATTLSTPLLGPGYLSVKEPDKAFLVGQTNVVLLPKRYIQCVQALISFCRENEKYKNIPWIVNTMGYNKGFGDEIIGVICRFLNPTNIVQLESKKDINNFDRIMSKENLRSMQFDIIGDMFDKDTEYRPEHFLTLMHSVVESNKRHQHDWELNPRDMRLAMIISRLSGILKGHAEWLTDIKPVCASVDDLKFVNFGDENLNSEDLLKGLVGNLVYMCKQNSNSHNECIGIGIVRGIDFPLRQIYLLPAISMKLLEEVNCLAICGIPLPSSILINQGPKVKGVASYVYNTIDRSASMHIKQIYHRPQHFLTGSYKTIIDS